jgi:hypothetical protein
MALTRTRTRTQTALNKLAELVANINGELEAIERLLPEHIRYGEALEARRRKLEVDRDALYLTLKQFDAELDPNEIGTLDDWMRPYGRRGAKTALLRYLNRVKEL